MEAELLEHVRSQVQLGTEGRTIIKLGIDKSLQNFQPLHVPKAPPCLKCLAFFCLEAHAWVFVSKEAHSPSHQSVFPP